MSDHPDLLDPVALQRETRRLRGLARELCGDPHLAEDLVQEAWVTALQKPPRAGFGLGTWLAGITRNHARQERRDAARRRRREERAARPERDQPDPRLERLDLLRHLLAEVRSLAEPYRTTLLRHYLEGESPRQIGAAMGCPPATVRTRLHRGLHLLRERLDQDAGSRRAWLLPLIPLCDRRPRLPPPASPHLLPMAQLSIQKTGLVALAVVVLCCAAGLLYLLPGAASSPEEAAGQLVDVRAAQGAPAAVAAGSTPAPERSAAQRDALPAAADVVTVRGQVCDELGRGIAAARVELLQVARDLRVKGGALPASFRIGATAGCDADGRFELQAPLSGLGPAAGGLRSFGLRARADGFVAQRQVLAIAAARRSADTDFALRRSLQIEGRVVGEDGTPVAGAEVWTWQEGEARVRSGADGGFALRDLDPGRPQHWVHARAEGYLPAGRMVRSDAAGEAVELRLARGAVVEGTLRDPGGRLLAGATVEVGLGKSSTGAETDARGFFRVAAAPPGEAWVVVQHPGARLLTRQVQVPAVGQVLHLDLQLEAGRSLRGRVVGPDGGGVGGAMVQALGEKGAGAKTYTDAGGGFELGGLAQAPKLLATSAEGYGDAMTSVEDPAGVVLVELPRERRVHGQVLRAADGQPVPAFEVAFLDGAAQGEKGYRTFGFTRFSSGTGRFVLAVPDALSRANLSKADSVTVQVRASGFAPQTVTGLQPAVDEDPAPVPVLMAPGLQLTGEVRLPGGRPAAAGTRVELLGEGQAAGENPYSVSAAPAVSCDAAGRFRFDDVPAGRLRLLVRHAGFGTLVHDVQVRAGVVPGYRVLELAPLTTLVGTLLDGAGQPLAETELMLAALDVPGLARSRAKEARSDGQGRFRIEGLQHGLYRLGFVRRIGEKPVPGFSMNLRVTGAGEQAVTFTLEGAGAVEGEIRGAPELPGDLVVQLQPVQDEATPQDERRHRQYEQVRDRRFRFPYVRPGVWQVVARWEQGGRRMEARREVRVTEGVLVAVVLEAR